MHHVLKLLFGLLASATFWTAVAAIVVSFYTYYARRQWIAAEGSLQQVKRAADAAQEALEISRDQLRISVRPWVGVTDEPGGLVTSPLKFDNKGSATIKYSITTRNFSLNAAQNVMVVAFLLVTEDLAAIKQKQQEASGDNYVGKTDMGFSLFPGRQRVAVASASAFDRSQMVSKSYTGKFQAYLVGSIGYRDQFGVLYHTNFIYWLVDPGTHQSIEFDAVPNTAVQGVFEPWHTFLD